MRTCGTCGRTHPAIVRDSAVPPLPSETHELEEIRIPRHDWVDVVLVGISAALLLLVAVAVGTYVGAW